MDKDIFEQLYRQHYAAALLYAQGLCRSRPLAEDMVQEAFCRAWLALPDGVVSFRSWLFRVLRNLIIDHLRRQKHLSDEDVPETADAATPESVLLQREDAAALYRAMERLGQCIAQQRLWCSQRRSTYLTMNTALSQQLRAAQEEVDNADFTAFDDMIGELQRLEDELKKPDPQI